MPLPYENTTAGQKALNEIQKILRDFGCNKFGVMNDDDEGTLLVQFEYRGKPVSVKASINGYAAAWLKQHPFNTKYRYAKSQHEKRALEVTSTAVCSIIRDWIKAQIMIIETGVLSFEGAFLGQILLSSGHTVLEHVAKNNIIQIEAK